MKAMTWQIILIFLAAAAGCSRQATGPKAEAVPAAPDSDAVPAPPPAKAAAAPAKTHTVPAAPQPKAAPAAAPAETGSVAPPAGAAPAAPQTNPILLDLIGKGVAMPDGSFVKLPPPVLPDGLDADAQAEALTKILPPRVSLEQFTQKSSSAPHALKIRTVRGKGEDATFRTIDLGFVAHGRWETLNSEKFGDNFLKAKEKERDEANQKRTVSKSGFLTKEEMAQRGLSVTAPSGMEQRFFYTTFTLFDEVEVSATRDAILTKSPKSAILAARLDPRFLDDAEYPNQWRSIGRDAAANPVLGPKQPYAGAGFYVKITQLEQPADAIFIEYHGAFHEPLGWFQGEAKLRARLPLVAEHEVKQFRIKLGKASAEEEKTAEK
jgi:hypothetical protein